MICRPRAARRVATMGLLLIAACRLPAPVAHVEGKWGVAYTATPTEADQLAALADELIVEIRAGRDGLVHEPYELWTAEVIGNPPRNTRYEWVTGWYEDWRPHRIGIRTGPGRDKDLRLVLAHELVHHEMGWRWRVLPSVVAEGLADVIAESLDPVRGPYNAAQHFEVATAFLGVGERIYEVSENEDGTTERGWHGQLADEARLTLDAAQLRAPYHDEVWYPDLTSILEARAVGYFLARELVAREGWNGVRSRYEEAVDHGADPVDAIAWLWPDGKLTLERLRELMENAIDEATLVAALERHRTRSGNDDETGQPLFDRNLARSLDRRNLRVGMGFSSLRIPIESLPWIDDIRAVAAAMRDEPAEAAD